MLPSDINTYARSKYNATGDTFFTDLEIYYYIYQAELEIAAHSPLVYEFAPLGGTVTQGVRTYNFPVNCRIIKRIEYTIAGGGGTFKLEPITFREDDALTLVNVASTTQGKPQFYCQYNSQLYLRPIPDNSVDTYLVYFFGEPAIPTAASVLELPTLFHMDLVDFVVKEMYAKDKDPVMYQLFDQKWQASKEKIIKWGAKRKRGDAFTIVMNEDNLAVTLTGPV